MCNACVLHNVWISGEPILAVLAIHVSMQLKPHVKKNLEKKKKVIQLTNDMCLGEKSSGETQPFCKMGEPSVHRQR